VQSNKAMTETSELSVRVVTIVGSVLADTQPEQPNTVYRFKGKIFLRCKHLLAIPIKST